MSTDIANLVGNTLLGVATGRPDGRPAARAPSLWRKLALACFSAPNRLIACLERRQAARDALIRHAIAEGKGFSIARNEIERAVLLTGRADMLFPSHFVHDRRHS